MTAFKHLAALCLLLAAPLGLAAQVRQEIYLTKNWLFSRQDPANAALFTCDTSNWERVTLPHDWAIYGPFSRDNDLQEMAILQDGQTRALEHAGRTGGLPFTGTGWYRTEFQVPDWGPDKRLSVQFDGAMSQAEVWCNGQKVGFWPYGYNAFHLDLTPYVKAGGANLLAVRLHNKTDFSRWYPGAGLYRNVRLHLTQANHIPVWGTCVRTPLVEEGYAKVQLVTQFHLAQGSGEKIHIETRILDPRGREVGHNWAPLENGRFFDQSFGIAQPQRWSVEHPALYTAESEVYENGVLIDTYRTRFGIRSLELVPEKGFYLNGERVVFQGVCMHHDLGPLGGAVNEAAIRRQIRILKDMGCNAIRTSHNMPAPELVAACDEMGMMLMVETFDEWKGAKLENGYHLWFDQWAEKDMVNVLHHFRNNPSVVMWCIGNEVPDQGDGDRGPKLSRFLQDICHREDPTRPVTQGMDNPGAVVNNNFAAVMDVAGFNYRPHLYQENYKKIPQRLILGSETASTVSSRGVYKFPVVRGSMVKYPDHQASSYDVEHCGWSNLPEDDFIQHEDLPYCMGEFVWTGFDYLGEPTPYYTDWPSHSSLFGIVDLAGLPKDRYYLYRSHWNKQAETLHILPHWNWAGREGEVTPIFVYTNHPSAELFINGKSQGLRTKDTTVTVFNSGSPEDQKALRRQSRYRLMWMDTRYEPGVVEVVAYDAQGREVARKTMRTAGKPHRIEFLPENGPIRADGKDLCFVQVRVVDKAGNPCPQATHEIQFKVHGAGRYLCAANGDPTSLEPFQLPRMKLFSGMLCAYIQSTEKPGTIVVEATAKGLQKAVLEIESR